MITRHERDAIVALASAFGVSFMAGVFSYTDSAGYLVANYSAGVGTIIIISSVYLGYRVLRRGGEFTAGALRQWRADGGE